MHVVEEKKKERKNFLLQTSKRYVSLSRKQKKLIKIN
jgi:hypothetical protein